MREILFRGKSVDTGKWVFGSFIPDDREMVNGYKETGDDGYIKPTGRTREERLMVEVDRESIGQYTGLKDKNGKRIFEGDIIDYEDEDPMQYEYHDNLIINRGVIKYSEGCFYWTNAVSANLLDSVYKDVAECEVVGNIYDNPELLEEET